MKTNTTKYQILREKNFFFGHHKFFYLWYKNFTEKAKRQKKVINGRNMTSYPYVIAISF